MSSYTSGPFAKTYFLPTTSTFSAFIKRTEPCNACPSSIDPPKSTLYLQCKKNRCLQPPLVSMFYLPRLPPLPCQFIKILSCILSFTAQLRLHFHIMSFLSLQVELITSSFLVSPSTRYITLLNYSLDKNSWSNPGMPLLWKKTMLFNFSPPPRVGSTLSIKVDIRWLFV